MRERIAAARAVFDRSSKMFLTCSEVHAQGMVVYIHTVVLAAGQWYHQLLVLNSIVS